MFSPKSVFLSLPIFSHCSWYFYYVNYMFWLSNFISVIRRCSKLNQYKYVPYSTLHMTEWLVYYSFISCLRSYVWRHICCNDNYFLICSLYLYTLFCSYLANLQQPFGNVDRTRFQLVALFIRSFKYSYRN